MNRIVTASLLAFAFCLSACSEPGVEVTAAEYGDDWPFTVESGRVACVDQMASVFITGGTTYGLNGFAQSRGYADIEPIWKETMKYGGPSKVNIGPMLDLGLDQCP